jgi:hypothetical protein
MPLRRKSEIIARTAVDVAAAWQEIKTTCYSTAAQLRGLVVERFAGGKKASRLEILFL